MGVVVFVIGCGFGRVGGGRKGKDTESRWFGCQERGGGAGIGRIGGGLGFGAAGVAGLLGLGEGGGEGEVEEGKG